MADLTYYHLNDVAPSSATKATLEVAADRLKADASMFSFLTATTAEGEALPRNATAALIKSLKGMLDALENANTAAVLTRNQEMLSDG